ncbi:inositol monophosphatase [Jannaschia sp. 2305UL9-9]|uniref:inositol monophosphatase family protein n=1 Tax=Jannaschia sp. 2305UL9-9 TaxID=3121638 RepID=UPI003526E56E
MTSKDLTLGAAPPDLATVRDLMHGLIDLIAANMPRIQETRYDITIKPDGSPVTASDVFLEHLIRDHLAARIPGVTFAGEETFEAGTTPLESDGYYAILDPIDGTENFCSGLKEWGVSFTLWHGGKHLGSLLLMPELGEHLMTGDSIVPVQSRIRGFSSSMHPEILSGMESTQESRLMGCAVYNLYNVVRGAFARFTNPRGAYSWDLLPGLMLAMEHNCEIEVEGKPYAGEFLEPGKKYRVDIRHRYDLHPGQGSVD